MVASTDRDDERKTNGNFKTRAALEAEIDRLYTDEKMGHGRIAQRCGVGASTVYRHVKGEKQQGSNAKARSERYLESTQADLNKHWIFRGVTE
jgi:transposase